MKLEHQAVGFLVSHREVDVCHAEHAQFLDRAFDACDRGFLAFGETPKRLGAHEREDLVLVVEVRYGVIGLHPISAAIARSVTAS
jgi:hypothetical protein